MSISQLACQDSTSWKLFSLFFLYLLLTEFSFELRKVKKNSFGLEGKRKGKELWALFTFQKILQNFSDSPSHQIFRCMHEVLNIDENKN